MSAPDRLDAERLRTSAGTVTIGSEILVLDSIGSTNDVVLDMASKGATEGLVVFAEHQTAGRGQHGNKWESAAHNGLWFSVLLRPALDVRDSARLTTWAAHTVASIVQNCCGLDATVKQPNDVYIDSRKVGGVLVEMRAQSQGPHIAILGIGLNVSHKLSDFPKELQDRATSLAIATKKTFDRQELAVALLQELDRSYAQTFGRASDC